MVIKKHKHDHKGAACFVNKAITLNYLITDLLLDNKTVLIPRPYKPNNTNFWIYLHKSHSNKYDSSILPLLNTEELYSYIKPENTFLDDKSYIVALCHISDVLNKQELTESEFNKDILSEMPSKYYWVVDYIYNFRSAFAVSYSHSKTWQLTRDQRFSLIKTLGV